MNTRIYKYIYAIFTFCTIWSCSDKDIDLMFSKPPIVDDEMELARQNYFYFIDIPGDIDWQVTSYPDWACPMNEQGKAGEQMQLFVESYDQDTDRKDTIKVKLSDGANIYIPLRQHGLYSDDQNMDAEPLTDKKQLKLTYGIGYSIDVIKKGTSATMKYNVFNSSPFNYKDLINALSKDNEADALFSEPLYSSRYESITGNSTSAISNQLSVNAGIEVGIKAFKFSVEAGYSSNKQSNDRYMYAMQEIQHIVGSRYMRAGMLRYYAQTRADVFQSSFTNYVKKLEEDPTNKKVMKDIIKAYGTHIITRGTLGGELKVSMQMKYTDDSESSKIHAALGLSSKVINVKGDFAMDNSDKEIASNTTIALQSYAGENIYSISPGTSFQSFQETMKDQTKMDQWVSSIKNEESLALIDIETIPIWDLMPTDLLRDNLRNYVVGDYQREQYGDDFKPDLYLVNGYDVTNNAPGRGSIYIPEIDIQIDVERAIVKELSETELSTVIYSGPKGNVNRNRGFFVGSSTRQPCKFHREKNGEFTTEVFDRLSPVAISQLYVDVTGDITIATKSASELYQTYTIPWVCDLSLLTNDFTAETDLTVTGTTDHSIAIADRVTLTLSDVNINNNIVCLGNATIISKDGTKNYVKTKNNEEKAGIQAGPWNTTLTLNGNGSLEVRGGRKSAGIGGKYQTECGNIIINSGNIKAIGSSGAGIGSGENEMCGTITINDGTIEAHGELWGPGIGAGARGGCEKIIINGGNISGNGGALGAGIGSGSRGECYGIIINGGTITVAGDDAPGIGPGYEGSTGGIILSKCTVNAKGGEDCPAIGATTGYCDAIDIREDIIKIEASSGGKEVTPIGGGNCFICCDNITLPGKLPHMNTAHLSIYFLTDSHVIITPLNQ